MLLNFVSLILLVSHTAAQISINSSPNTVSIGQQYTLRWTAAKNFVSDALRRMPPILTDACLS